MSLSEGVVSRRTSEGFLDEYATVQRQMSRSASVKFHQERCDFLLRRDTDVPTASDSELYC